jgi:hypothetical protein
MSDQLNIDYARIHDKLAHAVMVKVTELAECVALKCDLFSYSQYVEQDDSGNSIPVACGATFVHSPRRGLTRYEGVQISFRTEELVVLNSTKSDCAGVVGQLRQDHQALAADCLPVDHVCTCVRCYPSLAPPSGPRQGEHHHAIRFANDPDLEQITMFDKMAVPYLDGVRVYNGVEIIEGNPGTIWRFRGVPSASAIMRHICACESPRDERSACFEALQGNVTVDRSPEWMAKALTSFERWKEREREIRPLLEAERARMQADEQERAAS